MKNFLKIGIIVLVAVIGFSMTACDEGGSSDPCADGHDYNWSVTTPATCIAAGVETGTCKNNSSHTTTRAIDIDPEAHDWIVQGTPSIQPTCTETGKGDVKCDLCNATDNDHTLNALGHDWGAWSTKTAATCTAAEVEERVCSRVAACQVANDEQNKGSPLGHDWGEWTAISPGVEGRACSRKAACGVADEQRNVVEEKYRGAWKASGNGDTTIPGGSFPMYAELTLDATRLYMNSSPSTAISGLHTTDGGTGLWNSTPIEWAYLYKDNDLIGIISVYSGNTNCFLLLGETWCNWGINGGGSLQFDGIDISEIVSGYSGMIYP